MSTTRVTVRLKSHGLDCWHVVDVPATKLPLLKRLEAGEAIDVASVGRVVESGWGTPPETSTDYSTLTA